MTVELQLETAVRLMIAALLSMLIGLDRERRQLTTHLHTAGLRTHMLVGIGACLFTILSFYAFPGNSTATIAANIVTGVGFLGAGTIIRRSDSVSDLTTAASIWATAAIGMASGIGAWLLATLATLIIWFVLAVLRRFEPEKQQSR
ncbi:MAG: hypothetical protein OHK0023_10160 [Anaerolineae bacterium]